MVRFDVPTAESLLPLRFNAIHIGDVMTRSLLKSYSGFFSTLTYLRMDLLTKEISSLDEQFSKRVNNILMTLKSISDSDNLDSTCPNLQLGDSSIDLFPDEWRNCLQLATSGNTKQSIADFIRVFGQQVDKKVDSKDMDEKVDRVYIDEMMLQRSSLTNDKIALSVDKYFSDISDKIQQLKYTIHAVKQGYQQSSEYLGGQLNQIKRSLIGKSDIHGTKSQIQQQFNASVPIKPCLTPVKSKSRSPSPAKKRSGPPSFVLPPTSPIRFIYRSPYKKKRPAFVPDLPEITSTRVRQ